MTPVIFSLSKARKNLEEFRYGGQTKNDAFRLHFDGLMALFQHLIPIPWQQWFIGKFEFCLLPIGGTPIPLARQVKRYV